MGKEEDLLVMGQVGATLDIIPQSKRILLWVDSLQERGFSGLGVGRGGRT